MPIAAALVLIFPLWFAASAVAETVEPVEEPWRVAHDRLRDHCAEMASNLNRARELLLERVAGNDELVERLTPEPVRLREPGYGVLPQIIEDAPLSPVEPQEKFFSIEFLTTDFAPEFRDAALFVARAADRDVASDELVAEYERIRRRLGSLETHLGYHRYWQRAVQDYPAFFAERNEVIVLVRAQESGLEGRGDDSKIAAARGALVNGLAPFQPTAGLSLEKRDDGWRVLPVSVTTDIDDERFLAVFREGVEAAFADTDEMRALRFRVEVSFRGIPPFERYPEGPPEAHLARFPERALVLTTGGESTHSWPGRGIVLGPEDVSRRTLAHEFAHLLGFRDAYVRGFDGDLDDPFGVVLVEWIGLRDDLMGNARGGRVTREMVETLIEAYGSRLDENQAAFSRNLNPFKKALDPGVVPAVCSDLNTFKNAAQAHKFPKKVQQCRQTPSRTRKG